jgi:hypothetical protein
MLADSGNNVKNGSRLGLRKRGRRRSQVDSFEEWKKTQTRAKADSWPCGNLIHCTCWSRVQESATTMAGVVEFLGVCSRLKRPEANSAYSVGRS